MPPNDPNASSPGLATAAEEAAQNPAVQNALLLQGVSLLVQAVVPLMEATTEKEKARAGLYDAAKTLFVSKTGGIGFILLCGGLSLATLHIVGLEVDLNTLTSYALQAWNGCEDTP